MDLFKRKNIKDATAWDWNCPFVCKRQKMIVSRIINYEYIDLTNFKCFCCGKEVEIDELK